MSELGFPGRQAFISHGKGRRAMITHSPLELGRGVLCQSLIKRAEDRRCGVDEFDPNVGRDQGICLIELLAFDEVV